MRQIASVMVACLLAGGCTTAREPFPGQDPAHVWSALVAAAEQPDAGVTSGASRWVLTHNDVWVDEPGRRIEILRTQARRAHRPLSPSIREDRTWRFRVQMNQDEGVPTATFISRDWSIPAHVWEEAGRYFDDVWATLGGRPAAEAAAPPAAQAEPSGGDDVLEPQAP